MSIIDNMNLSNREELISVLQQANQPNPEAQQAQQAMQQAQMAVPEVTDCCTQWSGTRVTG